MRQHTLQTALFTLFLVIFPSLTYTQNTPILKLKSGNYNLTNNIKTVDKEYLKDALYQDHYFVYLHFHSIPTTEQKKLLKSKGVELLDYVPNNSYMARIADNVSFPSLESFAVDGVYLILPKFKMSYRLAYQNYPEYAVSGNKIRLIVQHHKSANIEEMDRYYKSLGARIVGHYEFSNLTTLEIVISEIQKLASHPLVKYIEPIAPTAIPEDKVGLSNHRSNYISNISINSTPYNGEGVWLAIGDDGELGPHIDYQGRINQTQAGSSYGSHGDHVAGIMMGAGNINPRGRGMAWGANLEVYDVWDAVNNTPTSYYNPGVVVTSTSYGNGCNAGYTTFAQTADQQVRQMPNLMHVFSAGNSGTSDCGYGAGAGWGNITGGIKAGKNVLAIGNVSYTDVLASSSSRGPASDGRIKPDLCANGTSVFSTMPNNNYANSTGTSMAAPGVSGTYGQLVHAYRVLNGGTTPPSALVKGAMLNTADDLGNTGPDFKYGWGRLNARRVLEVFENNWFISDTITQNSTHTHTIPVPAGTKQLKVMVYWNDYEGSTVTSSALVNNLDMTITTPSSTVLFPYILDPTPNTSNLNTPATNGIDTLNNMEQVVIDNPVAGNYAITITGTSIPQGPQGYYVIYEIIDNSIIVTYPAGGEGFKPGDIETIRWDAAKDTTQFTLEYSTDNGSNWTIISNSISSTVRYFNWTIPNVLTGQALIRISRNNTSSQSLVPFSIIGVPTNINFPSSCPNQFEVSWNPVSGATEYEVSILGPKYMDSILTTTGTSAFIPISGTTETWVSVKAKTATAIGERSVAAQKLSGIWNCNLPHDIELVPLTVSGKFLFNCVDYSNKEVKVRLINKGTNPVTNVPISFQFNGGQIVNSQYTGTINAGDSVDFGFGNTISFSLPGQYSLNIWQTTQDDNPTNDSIFNSFSVYQGTTQMVPYSEDFETFNNCGTTSNCEFTICSLTNGWVNAANGIDDDIDFRVHSGSTTSIGTGPNSDHKPGTTSGKYLYLEASSGCYAKQADLVSPCLDIPPTGQYYASMWYHMLGTTMGELHFDILSDGIWHEDVIAPIIGSQGSFWKESIIDLSLFAGKTINIRYRGITGPSWSSDIALDDFSVLSTEVLAEIIADSMPCRLNGPIIIDQGNYGAATLVTWDFGQGASPATANTFGPHSVTYPTKGTRTIRLIVSNSTSTDTAFKTINVVELPNPAFTYIYNTTNGQVEFTNTSSDYSSSYWEFGDGSTSTNNHPIHQYPAKGSYQVTLEVANECGKKDTVQIVNNYPLSINYLYNSMELMNVFPNPAHDLVTIEFNMLKNHTGILSIFDIGGKQLFVKKIHIHSNAWNMNVDLKQLEKGVYVVSFVTNEFTQKIRLLVH